MAGYTIKRLQDVPDVLGDYPGEMRMFGSDLDSEQVSFTFRRMPQHTGGKGSYGHFHRTQEEIYYIVRGTLLFKLDDEVIAAGPGTAIRVAPEVVRSVWNDEPEEAHLVIVSARLAEPQQDLGFVEDFWPENDPG